MKKPILIIGLILSALLLCPAAKAMKLDPNSVGEITTAPDHQVMGWQGNFAVSGNVSVWIDQRDPGGISRIYGVNLDDPCRQEFLIDMNAPGDFRLAISGPVVVYTIWHPSGWELVRVADITNQSDPCIICEFFPLCEYIDYLDLSGRMVAYCGNDANNSNLETVYAADITEANNVQQYTISVLPTDHYACGLAIDGNKVVWSANQYEPNAYAQVADIANPNDPNVMTAFLPENTGFDAVDASGDWLVAHGWYGGYDGVYAVHKYADGNNWNIVTLWEQNREFFRTGPRIDGPIAVWVTTTRMPSLKGEVGLLRATEYMLEAAYLTGKGGFTPSTLIRDTNEIMAADISLPHIVWSKWVEGVTDLFKGALELECGDWGYKRGDIDRNCKVDFYDFAVLAEDWLGCTMPDDPDCSPI